MTTKSPYFPSSIYIVLFTILFLSTTAAASSFAKISYVDHCNSVVPQSSSTGTFLSPSNFLKVSHGHFSGGEKLLAADPGASSDFTGYSNPSHFDFYTDYISKTKSPQTFELRGKLSFQGPQFKVKDSRRHRLSGLSFPVSVTSFVWTSKYMSFELSGFWSESTGMICMVGTGSSYSYEGNTFRLSAVFKLYYPKISSISTSIVSGTVESLDPVNSPNYFEKISVSAFAQKNYSYMDFPPSIRDFCSKLQIPVETRSFEIGSLGSYVPKLVASGLKLEHKSDCSGGHCKPFFLKKDSMSTSLGLSQIHFSKEGKFHTRIQLYNDTNGWFDNRFEPENSLVGEGFWDHERNRICMVACQVLPNASVGDCTFGLSLWFPLVLTIKSRSQVSGCFWSNHSKNDPGYFSPMSLRDIHAYRTLDFGMNYKYSDLIGLSECDAIKNSKGMGSKTYPDGSSRQDLGFSMMSGTKGGSLMSGHAYLLSIGNTLFADSFAEAPMEAVNVTLRKVAYEISYYFYNSSSPRENSTQITAEGQYNSTNGHLCMVGCMYYRSSVLDKQTITEDSSDCNILINVQFPPMEPKEGERLNGTIKSTRKPSDPLYFEPLLFSSYVMYDEQATKSIWRMNIEIIMIVISLTLSCIFIRSQIVYAKKHRDVLPAISITMLVVMTLGYLIPLILNFEALVNMIQNNQNSLLWSSEWMVVKEVIVRVLTLVAFVLHLRMLQVAWSARYASEGEKDLLVAERKTMILCLALYIIGAVIAWFVQSKRWSHWWRWEGLLSYAGFILDGFLFPQIMFNLFRRSQEKALSLVFYVGMTLIRIFPHLYDLYRAHNTMPHFQSSYIYASPEVDFYSLSWNIIISLAGILLATLIFLQQCLGGNYILPSRFKKQDGYMTIAELSL